MTYVNITAAGPTGAYPALMAYIHARNAIEGRQWCSVLTDDAAAARLGAFADIAADMDRADADYAAAAGGAGQDPYPCNSSMGTFLGLPLRANHEPAHGYYMARSLRNAHAFGVARREVEALIAACAPLRIVAARSTKTRKPVRFYVFAGPEQITIGGTGITARDGKRRVRLSSNWSEETCLQHVATAMRTGAAYGEPA